MPDRSDFLCFFYQRIDRVIFLIVIINGFLLLFLSVIDLLKKLNK